MRLSVLLIVGLLATVPTALAEPTVEWEDSETWDQLYDDGPVEAADETQQEEREAIRDDAVAYAFDADAGYFAQKAEHQACFTAHFAGHGAMAAAREQEATRDGVEGCYEAMSDEEEQKQLTATGFTKAVGNDVARYAAMLGEKIEYYERYAWDTAAHYIDVLSDIVGGG